MAARARNNNGNQQQQELATGTELLNEIASLHTSLSRIATLLSEAEVSDSDEIMSKTVKLVRRVRSLVHATDQRQLSRKERIATERQTRNRMERQRKRREYREMARRARLMREERRLRGQIGVTVGDVEQQHEEMEPEPIADEQEERALATTGMEEEDEVTRDLYETVSVGNFSDSSCYHGYFSRFYHCL